jgi:HK97 family phage major capsid protein
VQMAVAENLKGTSRPKVSMANGMPVVEGATSAVSRGRGAVYNKAAIGARMEETLPEDKLFTSMGEYCRAIKEEARPSAWKGRTEALAKLEAVRSFQNSFGSEDPGAGGFLVPEIMRAELLQLALEDSVVRSRATVLPMNTLRTIVPSVDDTSHVSSLFGGVEFYWAEESASLTESTATFGRVVLDAKKLTGFFKVPNELLADAPAFAGWFDTRIPAGLAWFEDVYFMTGTGVGEPLGFINCPAAVIATAVSGQGSGTIVVENLAAMYARMLPQSLGNAVWICSIDSFPQLATMALSVGTGGAPVWMAGGYGQGAAAAPPVTIYGRPVVFTEKCSVLGTTGDINLVDLSYYLIGDRQQMEVSSSDQYAFQTDQTAYRIIERVDGRPWLQQALTPHNNSSSTLSAFVQLSSTRT